VVPGFVPGVWKVNVYAVQAGLGQHVVEHFDRVVLQDADVFNAAFAAVLEQRTHTGFVDFAAQKIVGWPGQGNFGSSPTHAKADFQNQRGRAAKGAVHVQRGRGVTQQEARPVLLKRPLLTRPSAPRPQHVAFNDPHERCLGAVGGRGSGGCVGGLGVGGLAFSGHGRV